MSHSSSRLRYALIGTGSRAGMYVHEITGPKSSVAELVALADSNPGRAEVFRQRVLAAGAPDPLVIEPAALAETVRAHDIDRVIVTTPDATHAQYIEAALDAGADVIVEKPLTTSAEGIQRIAAAVERTGRSVTTTFNYRYSPRNTSLREIIASGEIGRVTSVDFQWMLDTAHGADYFRRWHRIKENSGGLLVHKSSHHFDLVNWWIRDVPVKVYASGGLRFYGADNAAAEGRGERAARGSDDSPLRDKFSLDLRTDPKLKELYYDQEQHDGYVRDQDVFTDGITIEDNLALIVDYASGATLSYSLNAHSPWEGYQVAVNGTKGRVELTVVERGSVLIDDSSGFVVDPTASPEGVDADDVRPPSEKLVLQKHFAPAVEVAIPGAEGGHGGGDAVLLRDLFFGAGEDPLEHTASWVDGVRSVSVGLAGNRSLETGLPVTIDDLALGVSIERTPRVKEDVTA